MFGDGFCVWRLVNQGSATVANTDLERAVEIVSTEHGEDVQPLLPPPRKGSLRLGSDLDLVVVDGDDPKTGTPDLRQGGADYSPYEGRDVTGWPTHSILRRTLAFDRGEIVDEPGAVCASIGPFEPISADSSDTVSIAICRTSIIQETSVSPRKNNTER